MKAQRRRTKPDSELNIQSPSPEEWRDEIGDLDLSEVGKRALAEACAEALQDVRTYQALQRLRLSKAERVIRLERMRDALEPLRAALGNEGKRLVDIIPLDSLADLGRSFSFEGIRKATGKNPLSELDHLVPPSDHPTITALEAFLAERRADYGLTHPHLLISHVVETLLEPVERRLEVLRKDPGGRRPLRIRWLFLIRLLAAEPRLLDTAGGSPTNDKLLHICATVLRLFGIPQLGLSKAVAKLRADMCNAEQLDGLPDAAG